MNAPMKPPPVSMEQALRPTTDPAWIIEQHGFDMLRDGSRQSRFAVSNGFLGVRGDRAINRGPDGVVPPCTYVAGLFDVRGAEQPIPTLVPAPDWLRVDIAFPGGLAAASQADVTSHYRTLDLRRGVLLSGGRLAEPGLMVRLQMLRLVSQSDRAIGLQLIQIDVEQGEADMRLTASFDELDFGLNVERIDREFGVWRTLHTGKRLAMAESSHLWLDGDLLVPGQPKPFANVWHWRAHAGQSLCFARIVAVARGDAEADDPGAVVRHALEEAQSIGWRGVLDAHTSAWADRWSRSAIAIGGDPAAEQAVRFAAYHLNGAANPGDAAVSVAARALTGPDYKGHVFWDTEIYLLPFYCLTWPEAARAMLMYRHGTLPAARAKAASMGWRGAMFAWESADTGAEATPDQAVGPDRRVLQILCGKQEQHITADVAYAVWHYWIATGDEGFLREAGAEILLEAGRFWASRAGLEADGQCHIRGVIGPDEYHETVDDNAFTNVMARWTIRRALDVAALMSERWPETWTGLSARFALADGELAKWRATADAMATGLDRRTGVFEQFAGYNGLEPIDLASYAGRSVPMDVILGRERTENSQIIKQADVVALLGLLPDEFAGDTGAINFDTYLPRCSHGSSLSRAMHGLVAARLGRSEQALDFLRQTCAIDLADTHAALDGGVHIASLGGAWMITVLGFAGITLLPDALAINPQLPACWSTLEFACQWRGRLLNFRIDQSGHSLIATLTAGESMTLIVQGGPHTLNCHNILRLVLAPRRSD
jgi:trehalose/maltose hydrolase-like predicted phosphorylase